VEGVQAAEAEVDGTIVAPSKKPESEDAVKRMSGEVEIMARLPGRAKALNEKGAC